MNRQLLRAIGSITLCLAAMGLIAYAFGRVTRTEWVWWLAPLTVALDGSLLFRAGVRGGDALLSLSELHIFRGPGASIYVASSGVAAGVAAWGAYTGNRLALFMGAAFAILARALESGVKVSIAARLLEAQHRHSAPTDVTARRLRGSVGPGGAP